MPIGSLATSIAFFMQGLLDAQGRFDKRNAYEQSNAWPRCVSSHSLSLELFALGLAESTLANVLV